MKHYALLPVLLAAVLVQTGCDKGNSSPSSMEELHRKNGVPVRVEVIGQHAQAADMRWNAVLSGGEESTASAMVSDRVARIEYKVGDRVAGDAVVVRFPADNPAANYNQARVTFEHARTTLSRMESLYKSGGISQQELDNVRTQFQVAEANWKATREAVNVEAPISGVITRINVTESQNVKAGDPLFTVADTRTLRARLLVTESVARLLAVGDEASAEYRGTMLKGRVAQVDRSMESKKQAYGVILEFANPGKTVASGSNALIRVLPRKEGNVVMIERKDLQRENDDYYVFVAQEKKAVRRPVTIGASIDTRVEILTGLAKGDRLITASQMMLEDGSAIRVVED